VETLKLAMTVGGEKKTSYQKQKSVSLHDLLSTDRHLLGFFVYNKPKVAFMHGSKHRDTIDDNSINSHAQNTTASQPMYF
jgi:hypothetical protein